VPSVFDEPTGDESTENVNNEPEYDSKKPPDYNDALAYRKPSDEGCPEPSLVDEPPPPSYDSVN